jgi:hypothetical protein
MSLKIRALYMENSLNCEKSIITVKISVADTGCLSRILIFTHPESRISDLGSRIQKQEEKRGVNFFVIPFFVATNFTKL